MMAAKKRMKCIGLGHIVMTLIAVAAMAGLSACAGGDSKPVRATMNPDGTQSIRVLVKNGYHPGTIEAKAGVPLTLDFYRDEPAGHSCDQELSVPSEKIEKLPLPRGKNTQVIVSARPQGTEVGFECGMGMMHGKVKFTP